MDMLIAGRVLVSFGISSQVISLAIPSEVIPHRWRSIGQGLANVAAGIGGIMGFLIPGAFIQYSKGPAPGESWRYAFYLEIGLWVLATLAALFLYNPKPLPHFAKRTLKEKISACDPIGTTIWACFTVPFLTGLNYGNNPYAWSAPQVVAPLVVGLVFFLIFIVYEWKINKVGIYHHGLFKEGRNFPLALVCQCCEGLVFICYISYYPFATSVLWEPNVFFGSVRAAIIFYCLPFAIVVGIWTAKTKRIKDSVL